MSEPIFVTGPDRSGTSLLFALLGSHPDISMVRRTNLFRWFYGRYGDLAAPPNFERCLSTLLRYERLAPLQPDPGRIRAEFAEGEPSYARLFEILHRQHAERLGKRRWGDKSLHTEHFADDVFEAFPDARLLHVMRDPRDRHASVMRRYDGVTRSIGAVTGRWVASAAAAHRNTRRHAGRYRVVRYEDLVSDAPGALEAICEFVGVPFDEAMLAMRGVPDHEVGNSSFETFAPGTISARAVGRFRSVLSPREVAFIELAARRPMRRLGYAFDSGRPSLPAMGDVPYVAVNVARMIGWRVAVGERQGRRHDVPETRLLAGTGDGS